MGNAPLRLAPDESVTMAVQGLAEDQIVLCHGHVHGLGNIFVLPMSMPGPETVEEVLVLFPESGLLLYHALSLFLIGKPGIAILREFGQAQSFDSVLELDQPPCPRRDELIPFGHDFPPTSTREMLNIL